MAISAAASPTASVALAPTAPLAPSVRPRDADGDNDGTSAAAPAKAPALATQGNVGTLLHAVA